MTKNEETMLFAGIARGNELKKSMLECSRDVLESMKKYEEFKSIKERKLKLLHQFRQTTKEIIKLVNMLKTQLPQIKEIAVQKPQSKPKAHVEKKEKPKIIKVETLKEKTEIEKLEEELNQIEEKLNQLA